ncbi:MAG: hypothetical protein D6707_09285 [Bacteroidetes bacterium]|nr:MAG: hypothetical protein D6707_09285 [Bacteroidota bacterium]
MEKTKELLLGKTEKARKGGKIVPVKKWEWLVKQLESNQFKGYMFTIKGDVYVARTDKGIYVITPYRNYIIGFDKADNITYISSRRCNQNTTQIKEEAYIFEKIAVIK